MHHPKLEELISVCSRGRAKGGGRSGEGVGLVVGLARDGVIRVFWFQLLARWLACGLKIVLGFVSA